jgi:hypothetical protein
MYEYKIFEAKNPKIAQEKIDQLAIQGWKVISVIPWAYATTYIVITMEKEVKQ